MKKIIFYASLIIFTACNNADSTSPANLENTASTSTEQVTTIEWIEPSKKLGKISEGQILQIQFKFKNSGNKPLVIKSVTPGCGCTVADFPKEPIPPGKEGVIVASFDSKGRLDLQKKDIHVVANTEGNPNHTLHFELEVVKGAGS